MAVLSVNRPLGTVLLIPLGAVAVTWARRAADRDDVERTDERAQLLTMTAKARAHDTLLAFLAGAAAYQWLVNGFDRAEPLVDLLIAALAIHGIALAGLRKQLREN